jgi:hypothetical protein
MEVMSSRCYEFGAKMLVWYECRAEGNAVQHDYHDTDRYATTCVDFYYKYHMFSREFPQVLGNLIDKGEITC